MASGGIAGECYAGGAVFAHIAVDHRLHVDSGAPVVGDALDFAVADRAVALPRREDGADGAVELFFRVFGEAALEALFDYGLKFGDQLF